MDITPVKRSIGSLLTKKKFVIPRFQREYSWEKIHYKEFLEDIISMISVENNKLLTKEYFLGMMVFIGDLEKSSEEIYVVDGQQRLTTITILLSVLSQHFNRIKEKERANKIFEYVMGIDNDNKQFRILRSETSYPFFADYIQRLNKDENILPQKEEDFALKDTYDFFYNELSDIKLRNLFKKKGIIISDKIKYLEILQAIRDQLTESCIILGIQTSDRNQANKIFEILNAKGKTLTDIDLIKNEIFSVLKEEEPSDFARDTWDEIKDKLYVDREMNGLADFFRHYWLSKYGSVTRKQIHTKFLKTVTPKTEEKYREFLRDLKKNAEWYRRCIYPHNEDYNNQKEFRWAVQSLNAINNIFDVIQTRVFLLSLFDVYESKKMSTKDFKNCIIYLENFHFAYTAVCSLRPNKLDSIYSKAAIILRKCNNAEECQKVINKELIDKLENLFPDFNMFSKEFVKLSFSKDKLEGNAKTKYAINKLESWYSGKETFEEDGTIEHIISESNNEIVFKNIGNLILLESKLNAEAGNKDFSPKKAIYNKSNYKWVKEFLKNTSDFNNESITNRAIKLSRLYYENIFNKRIAK